MSSGHPELFVVCKNCGAEVSPYITECPYCGKRLRKRAPKLDREGHVVEHHTKRVPTPTLPRLRRGEIPGIATDHHAVVTSALVALGIVGALVLRASPETYMKLLLFAPIGHEWWHAFTTPFLYSNLGYAFVALSTIAIFGTLLERRAGPVLVLALFLLASVGGAVVSVELRPDSIVSGGNGAALAMVVAWSLPDLVRLRRGQEFSGDLLGAAVIAAVVALMAAATFEASWISALTGLLVGALLGLPSIWVQEL